MSDVIRFEDRWYILATSPYGDDRTRVLKHDQSFGLFDRYGDILPLGLGEQGLYHEGTRFLSRMVLSMQGKRPLLLSSSVVETNDLLVVDLTNPDVIFDDDPAAAARPASARGSIHLLRTRFLWKGVLYERWGITNHTSSSLDLRLRLEFEADFADIFEVRGIERRARGERLAPVVDGDRVTLGYLGLDGVERRSVIGFSPSPSQLTGGEAGFRFRLTPRLPVEQFFTVGAEIDARRPVVVGWQRAAEQSSHSLVELGAETCHIVTAHEQFNLWLDRSLADLHLLVSETPEGLYPAAGVPWYSTVFGRDGLITAYQWLWLWPQLTRGVLLHLAATQASGHEPRRDAEPGKILHESRRGEMAALGEIPFGRYYGSVDATPLFVLLTGLYVERTGDLETAKRLWPHIERALDWIDQHGDVDGDGFVEYATRTSGALVHHGWKDSADAVMHEDGRPADPPIALCEVQGYVYAARRRAAGLARLLGHPERAQVLEGQAEALRQLFDERFWSERRGTYALALDGKKQPCLVRTSNAGHCLWTGIALPHRAARLARTLLEDDLFSGWGVRTLGANEVAHNPMSYHNGSVWPHDNSLCAAGLAAYGFRNEAHTIAAALFEASQFVEGSRLPELICGFPRRRGGGPTLYPVACSPQAWSTGTAPLLVQSFLGLEIDAAHLEVRLNHPTLPEFLDWVDVMGLSVGETRLDLRMERHDGDVTVRLLRRVGPGRVVIVR